MGKEEYLRPHERPADEEGAKPARERRNFSIAPWISVIILGAGLLIYYLITLNFYALPTPLLRSDEEKFPDSFIAERARDMLIEFDKIGQKVVGSPQNEVEAIAFLREKFDEIDRTKNAAHKLEFSHTIHSGSFYLGYKPHGMYEWYNNIQNVQIRLTPATGPISGAVLLINSHYDTVPVSPGASDAGIMIMVMLETLRVLTKSPEPLRHEIVFLFNGAEEAGLKGAHAFITQHNWRRNITGLINLDSTGSGGKEILFQAGPDAPWLAKIYAKNAPHPYASALGEELFQMNLIPSDTDFRIFRDFGDIKGLDLAYSYNGYVYHTKYDHIGNIPFGTYQHTGANVLALAKAMANSEELDVGVEHKDGESIFFDYLSWFAISYSKLVAIIINICIGLFMLKIFVPSLQSMCRDCDYPFSKALKEFVYMFLIQAGSAIIGAGLSLVLCVIYDAVGRSLSYYSNPWLVFGLYWLPFIFGLCIGPIVYFRVNKNDKMDRHYLLQMWTHAQAILLTLILFLLTFFGIRSAFIILIPVVFYGFTMTLNLFAGFQKKPNLWIPIMAVGQLFPFIFFAHLSMIALTTFIPMAARGGPGMNPDLLICAFSFLMALVMTGFITPFIGFMRRDLWVWGGLGALIVATIIMIATPLGFPYKAEVSPQRHWIFHSQRNLYNMNNELTLSENGFLLLPMDRHSHPDYLISDMEIMGKAEQIDERCKQELFCGMPFYTTRMLRQSTYSYWIPADEPYFNQPVVLTRLEAAEPRMRFEINGPHSMAVVMSPMPGVEIERWSFSQDIYSTGMDWQDRPTYFVVFHAGIQSPVTFWVDLKVPAGFTGKKLDLGIIGHYSHFDEERTESFQKFIDSYPEWTHVTAWMNNFNGFEF